MGSVLRPEWRELTRRMLEQLIQPRDAVVEFAPGLGVTACARMTLSEVRASYTAIGPGRGRCRPCEVT